MPSKDTPKAADAATLVDRLPKLVSMGSIHLAHSEIERRRNELGSGAEFGIAGAMALAQAYERIASLEGQLSRVEYCETGEVMRPSCGCQGASATLWKCTHLVPAEGASS